ncbi:hypothetical protein GPECTOR_2g1532 [Gonium pectorale]|uniref:DUF493 domain-containing protein n=1 Tax=Gonium pectorale TaxID=33097 RepID=A0A150H336_GONPE|nr:hypothetical protein GPECTOR_2g1532 [Gonium pectorale]|eukprot:KXZ55980.1 hypothetical protein GPECTOR_2g1532 [Gonium pectorale]
MLCSGRLGLQGKLGRRSLGTTSLAITRAVSGDTPSSSGRDLSCSGGPVGFGTLRKGFKPQPKRKQAPPSGPTMNGRDKAEVLRDTNAEVASKLGGGPDDMWADWKRVDAKVNTYPCERLFTAVGSGGEDFRDAMVRCVEEVVGAPVPVDVRASSGGNYLSVRVGPVVVKNRDEVLAVFIKMREDKRLKFHL